MDAVFEKWWTNIIRKWEGGVANRPPEEDPGGYTKHGITIGYWKDKGAKILGRPATLAALSAITWDDAKKIAYQGFWIGDKINTVVNPAFRPFVADAYWLGGRMSSLGYASIAALNRNKLETVQNLYNKRMAYLKKLSNWQYNKGGWTNRANDLLALGKSLSSGKNILWIGLGLGALAAGGIWYYNSNSKRL